MSESFNITPPEVAPEGGERSFGQRTEFAEQYDIPFQKDYRRIEAIIPDPNDRSVISRAERIKWNDTGILQRVSPTADDPYSIFLANQFVMDGIKYLGTANPNLASSITTAEEAMAALPEIMATTRDHEITERIVEALYSGVFSGEIPTLAPANELQERSLSFLNTNAEPVTVSAVMMSLAGLDEGGRDALLAQIMDYWNRTDMTQAGAEQNFVIWQYQQAASRQQFDYSTRGVWGAVAEWATQPFRATSAIGRNIWAQAASPQDAWYRSHLSLGQNLSISLGQEAGSSQAQLTSGIFDGVMNVVLDPVAWVANAAAAVKMTRVLPLVAEGSKFKLAAQSFIPVRGANNLKLPWGTRSLTSRLTYVARSKRIDDFVASVPQSVKQAAIATDSPAKLAEMFPQWRRAVGFLEVMASRVKTEEQFDYTLKLGLTGGLSGDADTTLGITQRIAILRDKVTKLIRGEVAPKPGGAPSQAVQDIATGKRADELRASGLVIAEDRKAVEKMVVRGRELVEPSEFDTAFGVTRKDVGIVTSHKTGEAFVVKLIRQGDGAYDYQLYNSSGEAVGGVAVVDDQITMGLSDAARSVMNDVWDIALEQGDDLLALHGKSPSTSQIAVDFAQNRAKRLVTAYDEAVGNRSLNLVDGMGEYDSTRGVWLAGAAGDPKARHAASALHQNDNKVKIILSSNAKVIDLSDVNTLEAMKSADLNPAVIDDIIEYANKMSADAAVDVRGRLHLLNENKALIGADFQDDLTNLSPALQAALAEYITERAGVTNALRQGPEAFIINDMPTKVRYGRKIIDNPEFYKPRRFSGGSTSKSWWVRAAKARVFGKFPPDKINIADVRAGRDGLERALRYYGVDDLQIRGMLDRFTDATFMNRYKVVQEIITEAAEAIEHPLVKLGLIEFVNRQGIRGFGLGPDGQEVLMTSSRTNPLGESAKPFLFSHLASEVHLPDPVGFSKSLRRYKWSKTVGPGWITKGARDTTTAKRKAIVSRMKASVKAKHGDEVAAGISNDEWLAMAYASVGPGSIGDNAYGSVAHMANTVHNGWRWIVSAFSISMLAFRPVAWGGRVFLDETARAMFADMPSMLRNPVRAISGIWDAAAAQKANLYKQQNVDWAQAVLKTLRPHLEKNDPVTLVKEASKIIPDLLPRIADSGDEVAKWSASRIYFLVADLLNDAAIKNDFGSISAKAPSLRQQRRYSRSIRVLNEIGVDITQRNKDFGWGDNVPEMLQAGWAQQYGLEWKVRPVTHAVGQMTQDSIAEVARVYQRNLELLAGDVTARAAMRTLARRAAGQPDDPHDIWQIMGNQNYGRLNEEILRWANDKGYETINEAALVQRYMDEIIAPYVDHVLDPLLSKDPALRSAQLLEIADTRKLVTEGGDTLDLHKTSKGLSEMETLIERLDGEGTKVPDLYGLFSPSAWSNERPDNWWPAVRDFPSKIIQVFGDDATQALVRRPAYLHRFKNEKKYRMALGLSEREAEAMAHVAAFESVNHVMYNLQNATPFLKSMNQVIPFFTAFWEITSTWGWKVPMMQGGLGIGHAQVVRKIDRYFDAMRELGIVEYDETGSYRLAVDTQADKGKVVGDPLSRQLAGLIRNPLIATEHFFNLGHALKDDMSFSSFAEAWDRDGFTAVPTKYTFALSTPYDIENYGIGSAIDISISPQPFLQLGLSSLRQRLPFAASYKTENFDGVTLAEAAAKGQIDPMRLMAYNDDILREKLGSETVDMLRTNRLSLSSVNLEDIDLRMPNTGVFATFINEVFFPFGDLENASDTIAQFGPQWLKFAFRSFGLWEEGSEEDGFLGLHTANLDDNVTSSAVIGAYRHLYATEGIGEHTDKLRSDFYALATPYLQNGRAEFNDDGSLKWIGERPADANAVDTAYHALDDFVEGTMLRAIEVASSTLAMRSMLAFILPGTPRTFFEEEHALDPYYQALAIQRGGKPNLLNSDIDSIMQYVQALAADPSGGRAMRLFLDNHPELGPYLIGKSYWEPGGQPPLDREMDNYFRDVNDGLRSTLSPDVYQHLHLVRQNENSRQVAFIEVFGNDPFEAAAASLRDPQLYQDTMLEFNERREMLAWEDELNGSPYLTWKDRNRSDAFNIIEESQRSFRDWENSLNDVMQLAEADPSMNPQQLKETTSTLKRLRAGLRETMEEFRSADSDISWMQPSQRARLLYFQEVYSVYLDQLGEQYDRLDAASTNEETRPIWNQIARIKDAWDEMDITLSSAPHVTFPSPTEFQQENKNPILQDHAVDKAVLYPATFFDHRTVTNVTERYPVLRDYLPVTPFQRDVYDWYIDWTETISERYNNGVGEISYKEYQNQKKNLQNEFDRRRAENGMGPHIMYENLWDVQKMHVAGALPPSWQRYDLVARINAVQQLRARDGYASVGKDDPGRKAVQYEIWRIIETDPVFRQELMELGERMYGKALPDAFLNQFLFNDGR